MGRTGRAVAMVGKRFELREYPVPDPAPGTLLLRQELAGICGTDVHNWEYQRLKGEILLGHENVGVVERLGAGVMTDYRGRPLQEGDRVVFPPGHPQGTYVEMGHFVDVGSLDFNPNQLLVRQNLRLEAVLGYGGTETFVRALPILERNEFPFAALVDPILPLERVDDGFAALTSGYRLNGRDVIKVALRGAAG